MRKVHQLWMGMQHFDAVVGSVVVVVVQTMRWVGTQILDPHHHCRRRPPLRHGGLQTWTDCGCRCGGRCWDRRHVLLH